MSSERPRLARLTSTTLLLAVVYGIAIVVAGFVAPVYQTDSSSSSGGAGTGTDTLVGVNGLGVVFALAIPLLATVAVAGALWLRSRPGAGPFAWTITVMLAAFNLLAMLSIGVFILPVTAALIFACSTRRSRHQVDAAWSGSRPSA